MNKIMLYVGLAILLGTVTMVAPLAVLEPCDTIPDGNLSVEPPEAEASEQERSPENRGTFESNDMLTSPAVPAEPSTTKPSELDPQKPELCDASLSGTDAFSGLSSIGLMVVPSFLVALGAFVYLKKRMA